MLPWRHGSAPDQPYNDIYLETDQFGRMLAQAIKFSLGKSILNDNVFSHCVPKLAQSLGGTSWRGAIQRL